ncbi:MAG TPA: hypothetical protein VGN57_22935 [Pirellulaceae bacterium]|jgi:hypothetical protein|nr:hypothetical protein [Pirellulaceae bacterium]
MLLFLSDLHLQDDSFLADSSEERFLRLAQQIETAALDACVRSDGTEAPIEKVDVVFLGDVLDLAHSRRWIDRNVRPWSDPATPAFASTVHEILDATFARHAAGLERLDDFSSRGTISLELAGKFGPIVAETPIRFHYLVGERDWILHLPEPSLDSVRQKVVNHFRLSQSGQEPFPHDPDESPAIEELLRARRTYARHGDRFDALCFPEQRDRASLRDVLLLEVLLPFLIQAEPAVRAEMPPAFWQDLCRLTCVARWSCLTDYLDGVFERYDLAPQAVRDWRSTWDELVYAVRTLECFRDLAESLPRGFADEFAQALSFRERSRGGDDASRKRVRETWDRKSGSLAPFAAREQEFRNRRARYVVYGHREAPESELLDQTIADGYALEQIYLNAGMWGVTVKPSLGTGAPAFHAVERCRLLAIADGDELEGRGYATWDSERSAVVAPRRAPEHPRREQTPSRERQHAAHAGVRRPHFLNVAARARKS